MFAVIVCCIRHNVYGKTKIWANVFGIMRRTHKFRIRDINDAVIVNIIINLAKKAFQYFLTTIGIQAEITIGRIVIKIKDNQVKGGYRDVSKQIAVQKIGRV